MCNQGRGVIGKRERNKSRSHLLTIPVQLCWKIWINQISADWKAVWFIAFHVKVTADDQPMKNGLCNVLSLILVHRKEKESSLVKMIINHIYWQM